MEENRVRIAGERKKPVLLPMKGMDSKGNVYEVDNISLIKNGRRFLPVMGEFHFSRYELEDWEEELLKMRAGGVEIVATYVFWIHHEEKEGEWNFSGCRDLRAFLKVCQKINMPVWLRIGPWAHGECRNGGFPDWIAGNKSFVERTNDPLYLEKVEHFYQKLGEQAKGMMCRDGGPVIGVQLENEYGHCGGPSDTEEGIAHMRILKKLALEAGFEVPYYTATGWGGAYVVDGEILPVLGGYVDAPWAEHVLPMPASANFIFSSYKQDEHIGSDLKRSEKKEFTFDIEINPYLTAELGGGLQVTSHRRTWPSPGEIEAQSLCMLGGGANLLGYYMYHGGINPDGTYSTLQESRDTGYNNDLPVKSYDFQTCIRESGEINASLGRLKKLHLMLADFGEILANAQTFFPENMPESPEDLKTLRVTARIDPDTGAGFLFLNNCQRNRKMKAHHDFSVRLCYEKKERVISHLNLEEGECAVIPFDFPLAASHGKCVLEETNAALLCRLRERTFFYTDLEKPVFHWKGKEGTVSVLNKDQANRAFKLNGCLYLVQYPDSCLIEQDGNFWLFTKSTEETLQVYTEDGSVSEVKVTAEEVDVVVEVLPAKEEQGQNGTIEYRDYRVKIGSVPKNRLHQVYLELDYAGDRAEVYQEERLVDDWFTTGEKWHLALKRFGYPDELVIRIFPSDKPIPNPYDNQVYYELPVEKGCVLHSVKALPEYKILLEA